MSSTVALELTATTQVQLPVLNITSAPYNKLSERTATLGYNSTELPGTTSPIQTNPGPFLVQTMTTAPPAN
ncbi:hypothetical protein CHS0354_028960, partial [Potamilus streckersoni]